jgi:protein O-mannosyl-transferase
MAKKRPEQRKNQTTPPSSQTTTAQGARHEPRQSAYTWMGILAAALGVLLYINTIGHDYTLDDYSAIKENLITKKGLSGIPEIFRSEYRAGSWTSPGSLYRPLTLSMFAIEWQLSPDKPMLGHLMNILLYGLTGWVLFAVWRRVLKHESALLAGLIALLFIAHPVHTEVVANIKSRDEILALLFCSGVIWFVWNYLDRKSMASLILALLCYTAALFSKESSITWLAVLPLSIWVFRQESLSTNVRTSALFLAPAALFLAARSNALANQKGEEIFSVLDNFMVTAPNAMTKLSAAFVMCWQYLYTLIFPLQLVSDRGYPQFDVAHLSGGQALLGFGILVGAGAWAIWQLLKSKQSTSAKNQFFAFVMLTFLGTFSLFSNLILTIGTSYGERLLYLPSLAWAMGVAYLLYWLFDSGRISQQVLYGVLGVILGLYSLRTVTRNPDWKTSYDLYKSDISKSPNCAKLNYHLAIEHGKEALDSTEAFVANPAWLDTALIAYNRALQLYPDYHDCFAGRGLTYFRMKKYDEAYADYQKALKYRPDDAKVLSNTGFIYFVRNDLAKAEEVYLKAVAIDPRFVDARRNLGAVYAMTKRFPQAIEQFEAGLKFEPRSAILWFYVGSAYRDMGQLDKAQPYLDKAYALDPSLKK